MSLLSQHEHALLTLTEAVRIDDPRQLMDHLAKCWRSMTHASAVILAVEEPLARGYRTVLVDEMEQVSFGEAGLSTADELVESLSRKMISEALSTDVTPQERSDERTESRISVRHWQSEVETRSWGVMLLSDASALPENLDNLLCRATQNLLAQTIDRERLLRDAKLESMAEFAAGAGHEINNPLAAISGRAQLLLREERDPERRRHLATIGAQALRIRDMIGDSMLFARPPKPEPRVLDLAEIVDAFLEKFADDCEQLNFIVTHVRKARVLVWADETQLKVVVSELLRNAIEASPGGGAIQIELACETEMDPQVARLSVRDEGPGLSPEAAEHLFDPFYSGRQAGRGLGFGLSKCWRIVTNHGGRIDVDEELQKGFGIVVRWPTAEPQQPFPLND